MQLSQASNGTFPSDCVTIAAGVAIFHLATARVVVCYHTEDKFWFLPKGRKNANEDVRDAAAREGFEESGYRNRLLPLPFVHRQTPPDTGVERYATEAIRVELMALRPTVQYMLFWYIAETLPPDIDESFVFDPSKPYVNPPQFPQDITLGKRIALDSCNSGPVKPYEPKHHEGTGVNEDERCYRSFLLPIDEAIRRLIGTSMAEVVKVGWESIERRRAEESKTS